MKFWDNFTCVLSKSLLGILIGQIAREIIPQFQSSPFDYTYYNLDLLKTDFEISRSTSGLTSEANFKFTTFFSVANPLILFCVPPQIFIVAERTRSDPAISPTRSGVTTSKPKQDDKKQTCLPNLSRTSCITYGYFSHLILPCVAVGQSANASI